MHFLHYDAGYFLLLVLAVVAAYEEPDHYLVAAPLRLELLKIGSNRLNAIPVVPRPAGFQRPGGFRRPTTTPRPFRKRPTTSSPQPLPVVRPQTRPPQVLPVVRPQTRPPQILPVIRPQPARPQVQFQPTTPRPLPATVPPLQTPLPSDTFIETNVIDTPGNPETVQFPETSAPNQLQNPIVVIYPNPSPIITSEPNESFKPILSNPQQSQMPSTLPDSVNEPFGPPILAVPEISPAPTMSDSNFPQQLPVSSATIEPQIPSVPDSPIYSPENPSLATYLERPPAAPSQSQSEAQPPFEGPNLPPNPPTLPTFSSSQANTGAGGSRPQKPLDFPVARPPLTSVTSRPPFRPRPPPVEKPQSVRPPSAQPPFDSGPHVPPKPPPVPTTSTTSFGVNPAPPSDKPQRPLPPLRPILLNPLPPPKPPFQLATTEKPSVVFNESSMTDDGNYTFDFLVSNSVYRKEQGFLKKSLVYPGHLILVKTGAYSFTSPEGTFHRVDFVADERGYRAFESAY